MLLSLLLSSVTVTVPMEATVRGTEIELAEIASIEGDARWVAELGSIELGYAPAPGYSRLLRVDKIQSLLHERLPEVQVRFAGHTVCRVRPEVRQIPVADLEQVARAELRRAFAGTDLTFQLAESLPQTMVPAGDGAVQLRARPLSGPRASGLTSVAVEVAVDDAVYRTVWTTWKVEVWQTRSVLARPVRAGQALEPSMFERRRVLLRRGVEREALGEGMLPGAVATRDLMAGAVITATDVHRPTVLQLGDQIYLLVRKGGIQARVPAVALDSGAVGDRVRVRMNHSPKEMSALVRSADLVEVNLGQ